MFASSVRFKCSHMQNFNIEFRSDGSLKRFVPTVRSANFALRLRFEYSSGFARDRFTHQLHCRSLIFAYLCRFHVSSMSPVCRRIVTMCYRGNWLPIGGHCLPFEYIQIHSNSDIRIWSSECRYWNLLECCFLSRLFILARTGSELLCRRSD